MNELKPHSVGGRCRHRRAGVLGRFALTVCLLTGVGLNEASVGAQPMDLPAGVVMSQVLRDGWIQGQRASVWELKSADTPADVASAIERRWRTSEAAGVFRSDEPGWFIVSRVVPGAMETVQLRVIGSTALGYLTRWRANDRPMRASALLMSALPSDLTDLRQILGSEEGQRVSILIARSRQEPAALLPALERSMARLGMARVLAPGPHGRGATGAEAAAGGSLLRFQGDRRELMLTLDRHGPNTVLVFHLMEAIR